MTQNVKGLTSHEVLVAFSSLSKEAFIHIHYDQIDEKNHKSLNTIVHSLGESGYHEFADVVEGHKPYAVFENANEALHAYEFINEHSAAVNASLYYKGLQNAQAETLIRKEFAKVEDTGLHHTHSHKR